MTCPFCEIVADPSKATDFKVFANYTVAFRPLNPVTPGHMLVIPVRHVHNVGEDPKAAADAMYTASLLASRMDSCNVITSQGDAATQTIRHLHLHVVPRRFGDDLALPWASAVRSTTENES